MQLEHHQRMVMNFITDNSCNGKIPQGLAFDHKQKHSREMA
jgi:hypothetical protein